MQFNNMYNLPNLPYQIMTYLATDTTEDAENIWKLLAYNDYGALSKPNLTFAQKMNLIWQDGKQDDCGVFFSPLIEDAIAESKCILKVYSYVANPINVYLSAMTYAFDFLYGGKMAMVEYNNIPVSRGDLFVKCLLSVLNGKNIGGIGLFAMDDNLSAYCGVKYVMGNQKTFTGVQVFLATQVGGGTEVENCEN